MMPALIVLLIVVAAYGSIYCAFAASGSCEIAWKREKVADIKTFDGFVYEMAVDDSHPCLDYLTPCDGDVSDDDNEMLFLPFAVVQEKAVIFDENYDDIYEVDLRKAKYDEIEATLQSLKSVDS